MLGFVPQPNLHNLRFLALTPSVLPHNRGAFQLFQKTRLRFKSQFHSESLLKQTVLKSGFLRNKNLPLIPFHYKADTFGNQGDKEDTEDKGEDLYQEFCEMV
jgi:hypothetical protein